MKAAIEMKINFDDYKILNTTTEKNGFNYECTKCKKKMSDKIKLIHVRKCLFLLIKINPEELFF